MQTLRFHPRLPALPHLPPRPQPPSSPRHHQMFLKLLPPRLPFPLNLQSPAAPEPLLNSSDEPGRERAKATQRLPLSSPETQCCWMETSRGASWPGSPRSGTPRQVEPLVAWTFVWSPGDLGVVSDPEGGG